MDLTTLSFKTDTSQLKEAADKIAALGVAIAELASKQKSAAEAAKDDAKAKKIQLKLESDLIILKEKLAAAEANATEKERKRREETENGNKPLKTLEGLLGRLSNMYIEVAGGATKWEASIIQQAKTMNATADQMQAVRTELERLSGLSKSPFDSAIGGIRRLQGELDGLKERTKLADEQIFLSTKQLEEYSRIAREIKGQMIGKGIDPTKNEGLTLYNSELAIQQQKYLQIAEEVNRVTAAEKIRNENLNIQRNIMAGIEQSNKNIQSDIDRNTGITTRMRGGMSQSAAASDYDTTKLRSGATTTDQATKIQEQIDLTNKLTDSKKKLTAEIEKQNTEAERIAGLTAQRKAIDDLNKSIIENIAERKKMDDLMQKYSAMGLNNTNAREASQLEMKGASQASIDSLKTYLLGVQAITKAKEDQKKIDDDISAANQRSAREAAATRYSGLGHSSSISNTAAGMEVKGIPAADIQSYIQDATAKEQSNKATRELTAAKKYLIETEERLAQAVNNANQNLNRQSTDELAKYQKALGTVGTTTDETTRKMAALKAQLDLVAGKERQQQLSHLSRAISTQMGDVGISLASGMNPLTVALQQGDQIRFALQQAGAEGAELQKAMNGAATQIASSIALVFKAVSGFIAGVFITAYRSIETAAKGVWQFGKDAKDMFSTIFDRSLSLTDKISILQHYFETLSKSLIGFRNVALGLTAVLVTGLAVGLYKVLDEQEKLSKQLILTGGSMGVSKDSALAYAESMNSAGISTGKAVEVIAEMAKQGGFFAGDIAMVTKAAVDMKLYAGIAIEDTVKEFANLRKDPVHAIEDLAIATGMIAPEVVRAVIELKEQGKTADAVALAMSTLAGVEKQQVAQMKDDFTGFAIFMKNIGSEISGVFANLFKGLWNKTPINEALRETRSKLLEQVAEMENNQSTNSMFGIKADMSKLTELKGKIESINKSIRNNELKDSNETQAKSNNAQSAKLVEAAEEVKYKFAEKSVKLTKERAGLVEKMNSAEKLILPKEVDIFKKAIEDLDKKIKEAKDAEAKKARGPSGPKSSFRSAVSDVSLVDNSSNIQKEYQSELSKTEKFVTDQRSILKLSYEAGLVSKGEYLAKDIDLIQNGQAKELGVIQKYSVEMQAENDRMIEQVNKRKQDALDATSDPGSIIKIERDAKDAITRLTEAFKAFRAVQQDKSDSIASESTKRYYESLKEQNQAVIEAKKHLEELNKTTRDAAEARRMDAEFQMQALVTSGSELAMYKAKNDTLQSYIKIKDKLQQDLGKAEKEHSDFTNNATFDGSNQEPIEKSFQQWKNIEMLKQQIIQAGIDSEAAARNAATDAFNKYYMDKAMEVRDGTANAITEGIMNGGKAGSDAIKNVLNSILKDLLNNVFKAAIGSLGNSIATAISGQQTQQSSGGGFFQTLIGAGLSALGGGLSGGFGGGASSAYSLTSGPAVDMTSGFKLRATGGFVNQGSSYMVGEKGPEMFVPRQAGSIVPNHKLKGESSSSNEPMKLTIINNTSSPIGKVTERQVSATEKALVIEEAIHAFAAQMSDPNSKPSKAINNNFRVQRNR